MEEIKPIFCKECNSPNTFVRNPDGDWKTESGIVVEKCWICVKCHRQTWYPTKENYAIAD